MKWVQLAFLFGLGALLLGCGAGASTPKLRGRGGQSGTPDADPGVGDDGGGLAARTDGNALTDSSLLHDMDAASATSLDAALAGADAGSSMPPLDGGADASAADGGRPASGVDGALPPGMAGTGGASGMGAAGGSHSNSGGSGGPAGTGGGGRSGAGASAGSSGGAAGAAPSGGTGGNGAPAGDPRDAATQPPPPPGTVPDAQAADAGVAPPPSGSSDAATGGSADSSVSADARPAADAVAVDAGAPPSDAMAAGMMDSSTADTSLPPPVSDAGTPPPPPVDAGPFVWNLPPGFPAPVVPVDNPMSTTKVELGRHLFYDQRLSGNQTYSCASCHAQSRAFTDGRAQAVGSTGQIHPRSSMGLTNTAYNTVYAWADPSVTSLEAQAPHPMFGVTPVELGLAGLESELLTRLRAVPYYQAAFPAAFPDEADPVSLLTIVKAIAAFERTLISGRSDYDRATFDSSPTPLGAAAQRGKDLFFSDRTHCSICHAGFNFTEDTTFVGQTTAPHLAYQNIGLYNIGGTGAYVAGNGGVYESTHDVQDMGKFKAPSLRNLSYTAPYMHDGSVATLEEVIEIYAAGGRVIASGPNAGDGTRNPYKDVLIEPLDLTAQEKADLLAFLRSLDDPSFVTDPRFGNPW